MVNYERGVLIILPHLDDEFALVPLIKKISSYSRCNLKLLYCAERNESCALKNKRREENVRALKILGCFEDQITYLNDYFPVNDLRLIDASKKIYLFIESFLIKNNLKQMITLNLEGGHPDHDSLALIIEKIATNNQSLCAFFVPAYNSRNTLILPVSVFRPLKAQEVFFVKEIHPFFIWLDILRIAYIYTSERSAFIKLLPFIIYKSFFSRSIYISKIIDIETVNWVESLSMTRYSVKIQDIIMKIEEI